jgi:hypothetical protein
VLARPEDFDNSLLLCVTPAVPDFPVQFHPTKRFKSTTRHPPHYGGDRWHPAFRIVHGSDRQVFETTLLLTHLQHHIIGTFEQRALSSFVQSGLLRCFAYSCGIPGRKSEDVWIVFPLESKIEETRTRNGVQRVSALLKNPAQFLTIRLPLFIRLSIQYLTP